MIVLRDIVIVVKLVLNRKAVARFIKQIRSSITLSGIE